MNTNIDPKEWYIVINELLISYSNTYNVDLESVVGCFALLSPQKKIDHNILQLRELLQYGTPKTGMFSTKQANSCKRVLNGESFLDVAHKNSHKIRNFYANCLNPYDTESVCIDTHIIRYLKSTYPYSLLNKYTREQIFRSKKLYNHCVRLMKKEAEKLNMTPSMYQAHIWCQVRGAAF